ncbi:MAG: NADH-ubiquinone oxidoreductase-F iron-sulfur binding region domain-containing protein [Thermoguttaceae bacterium]
MKTSFEHRQHQATRQWDALQSSGKPRILVGTASCGRAAGALEVLAAVRRELADRHLDCHLIEVGCMGLCWAEPMLCITRPPRPSIWYANLTPPKAAELVESSLVRDDPRAEQALGTLGPGDCPGIARLEDIPAWRLQFRRTLRNCGLIDPGSIDHSLANGGYSGLVRALGMTPEQVIDQIKQSGLRGRGGAGFPAWRKWQLARQTQAPVKYIICNGSEGDPGTFSNRLLLESDPHLVLEGILIAGYAVGAEEGYVYCPAEYPVALQRLRTAIEQMEDCGLLGERILGSSWAFHLKIKQGAGAYICGEESALIECMEGRRGLPRLRPPFPPVCGLWGRPTVVNNVETLACAAQVMQHGADWFARVGTEGSKGTKLFCLSGSVKRPGVIEVPFGMTLRQMIEQIGGGALDGKRLKAAQTGGPAGGCLPPEHWDLPVDQDSLVPWGSPIGSGGVVVLDEDCCMVDLARNALEFARRECCGRCVPCRLGTQQMHTILGEIAEGRGQSEDLSVLVEIGEALRTSSLCGLGQAAANPFLAALRYFRGEYEAHVIEKACPAGVCRRLACPGRPGPT